jgi:hypothetical protein
MSLEPARAPRIPSRCPPEDWHGWAVIGQSFPVGWTGPSSPFLRLGWDGSGTLEVSPHFVVKARQGRGHFVTQFSGSPSIWRKKSMLCRLQSKPCRRRNARYFLVSVTSARLSVQ